MLHLSLTTCHTHTLTHTHTRTHARTHSRTHARTHARTHTHTHKHTHTNTHSLTRPSSACPRQFSVPPLPPHRPPTLPFSRRRSCYRPRRCDGLNQTTSKSLALIQRHTGAPDQVNCGRCLSVDGYLLSLAQERGTIYVLQCHVQVLC